MQRFTCTSCGKVLKVSSKLIGKKGRCPKCGTKVSFVEEKQAEAVIALKMQQSGIIERPPMRPKPKKAEVVKTAPYQPVPVYRSPVRKANWKLPIMIALGSLMAAGVGFRFAFPDEAKSIWAKIAGEVKEPVEEKPVFASLELEVEKEALPIVQKIWKDFPELDDGEIEYEDGYVVVTQAGHNELDAQVGKLIENELLKKVKNEEFVKHIDYLQDILEKLDDEGSPLHLITGLSKVSAKSKVQEEIFEIAIDAWEDNFTRQNKKIKKLSTSLVLTKIHEYIELEKQISGKTDELIEHSKPSEKTNFGDELFAVMRIDLIEKFELSSASLFDSVLGIIKNELKDKDKSKEATDKVAKLFELYDGFVTHYKIWDEEEQGFKVWEFAKLPGPHQLSWKRREERIVNEVNKNLGKLSAPLSKRTLEELSKEYPDSKGLVAKLSGAPVTVAVPSKSNQSSLTGLTKSPQGSKATSLKPNSDEKKTDMDKANAPASGADKSSALNKLGTMFGKKPDEDKSKPDKNPDPKK